MRPWTPARRLLLAAVPIAALSLGAPGLLPAPAALAQEAPRATDVTDSSAPARNIVQLEGTLEILHEDHEDGTSRYHHTLATDNGTRWTLDGVPDWHDLLTGDRVRVRGSWSGKAIQLQLSDTGSSRALEVLALAPLTRTFGPQKTVVLLANFLNDPSQPATIAQMRSTMASVDGFIRENSYQQTWLETDVFGWYTVPVTNATCSTSSVMGYADQAAQAAGVDLSVYARRIYAVPYMSTCGFAGASTLGGNPSIAFINGQVRNFLVINHELGHSFGLYHSHALRCPGTVLGTRCTSLEYGDVKDTMGNTYGHFNAFQKLRLGWLDYNASPPITTVQSGGTYTIDAYELPGTGAKALRIPRGTTGESFLVELRRSVGFNVYLNQTGVFVHLANASNPNSSYLLDMTPETSTFSTDAHLDVGKTFTDAVSGITITTLAVSSTSATIVVDMVAAPACTRAAPRLTATPGQSPAVLAGTDVTYTVSVTNTDSAACAAASFALQATAPAGWQKTFATPSVSLSPGATASTTLLVSSPAVPPGAYTIGSAATSRASSLSGSTSMLYTVTEGPTVTPGTFTDEFDRPNAPALDNGWVVGAGSLLIQAGEARNQPTSTFSLAVRRGLTGPAHVVEASFASTNNDKRPRFGIVVRYQTPQNYYLCSRLVGGRSFLRIAKVENGVETVLKSVAIRNPAMNAFSRLSCQVSGTTLTLGLDGVTKLTTSDGTFSTGSAGFMLSTQAGGTHRADNFSVVTQ